MWRHTLACLGHSPAVEVSTEIRPSRGLPGSVGRVLRSVILGRTRGEGEPPASLTGVMAMLARPLTALSWAAVSTRGSVSSSWLTAWLSSTAAWLAGTAAILDSSWAASCLPSGVPLERRLHRTQTLTATRLYLPQTGQQRSQDSDTKMGLAHQNGNRTPTWELPPFTATLYVSHWSILHGMQILLLSLCVAACRLPQTSYLLIIRLTISTRAALQNQISTPACFPKTLMQSHWQENNRQVASVT